MRILAATACCLLLLTSPQFLHAQTKTDRENFKPLRDFVQSFYDWYVPLAQGENSVTASDLALKYQTSAFSPELYQALKEDSEAQAKATEIVGLDFDPFLNTQDPCEHYEVGKIARKGEIYKIDVHSVCSGKKSKEPAVVPEVMRKNGRWVFMNFVYENLIKQYPNSADLMSMLKLLRQERQNPSK